MWREGVQVMFTRVVQPLEGSPVLVPRKRGRGGEWEWEWEWERGAVE